MQKFVQKFFLSVLAGGWLDLSFGFVSGLYGGSDDKASAYNAGDLGSIPGWEDPLEKEMATHSSILAWRISMDRGAWWATVQGVSKSRTRLSD